MGYFAFYWLPTKIFPQEHTGSGVQKFVYNVLFMIAYIEVVIPILVLMKIFSILLFGIVLWFTKLAFKKWYYKEDPIQYMSELKKSILLWIFDVLDHPVILKNNIIAYSKNKYFKLQKSMTFYTFLQKTLFLVVFVYIIGILMIKGMYSYADPSSDTSQYIEWVGSLQQNILYADHKTFGAYFYGMPVIVFFVNLITNIDQVVLLTLYPVLLWIYLFLSIYYVVKEFSGSKYVGLFAVMLFGMVFMSPISDMILGVVVVTDYPETRDFYGFHFYAPSALDTLINGHKIGYEPYNRYMTGLAYEHSSIFVLLNVYFLIKTFQTKSNAFLIVYILSLFLIFVFHAGAVITLAVVSVLLAIVAAIARKYEYKLVVKALIGILAAAFLGSLWLLSMIKYGIPPEVGDAAPFLDKLIGTKGLAKTLKTGYLSVSIVDITALHLSYFVFFIIALISTIFMKRKFLNISILMFPLGVFIAYYGPHAGTIVLAKQGRLAEYLFLGLTLLASFHFYHFFYQPIFKIFKNYARGVIITFMYALFFLSILALPKFYNDDRFWQNINLVQYTSIPAAILKINSENRPFSWSGVEYVQSFSKIRNKGYHINTQDFLNDYSPDSEYLPVPTEKIYIFTENQKNAYRGLGEWYYRWRGDIQGNIKGWVAIYKLNHDNIREYYKTKTITVYEIDNRDYIEYLRKKANN
ncbi:MAG: hypothetical protein PHH41_02095 [Sulfurimonas sp.]|nr:hypothetical protein [Sulfurimonas sp.]MDD5201911.1 hypothetical protein [Sulfurimonas sp.]